jgi:hypothetical protein
MPEPQVQDQLDHARTDLVTQVPLGALDLGLQRIVGRAKVHHTTAPAVTSYCHNPTRHPRSTMA